MRNKNKYIALLFAVLFMFASVSYADIAADMDAGLPLEQVIENALDDGMAIEDIVAQMLNKSPDSAAAIIAAAIVVKPDSTATIAQVAINAGVDPAVVTQATAAPPPNVPPGPPAAGPTFPGVANANPIAILNRPIIPPVGGGGGVSAN